MMARTVLAHCRFHDDALYKSTFYLLTYLQRMRLVMCAVTMFLFPRYYYHSRYFKQLTWPRMRLNRTLVLISFGWISGVRLVALESMKLRYSSSSAFTRSGLICSLRLHVMCTRFFYAPHCDCKTRGQSNLTKSASRGAHSPVRGYPRGSKLEIESCTIEFLG